MIIDSHTHIIKNSEAELFEDFNQSEASGINIIGIKDIYPNDWIKEIALKYKKEKKKIFFTAGLSKEDLKDREFLNSLDDFQLLKIHPRMQNIKADGVYDIFVELKKNDVDKPVIIDMFPYRAGDYRIAYGNPIEYEKLLNDFPEYRVVFAHFGGIYLREIFMMMKCYKNLYADSSLITRYFKDSPIEAELYYYIKRLDGAKVLYGSDYPELRIQESIDLQKSKMIEAGLSESGLKRVMGENFLELIK